MKINKAEEALVLGVVKLKLFIFFTRNACKNRDIASKELIIALLCWNSSSLSPRRK
jgi:hypothetical protein